MPINSSFVDWIDTLSSRGRHSFTLNDVRCVFINDTEASIKLRLTRLTKKGRIISAHKGYYLIIPSQYASSGILPPPLFIDSLMEFLERPYYVGLLNAAAFYGVIPQQLPDYFVFTNFPPLRPTKKKEIKINYISKKIISELNLEKVKTDTGLIKVSNPALTAIDLVQFDKRIGGLNRATSILNELAVFITPEQITERTLLTVPVTTIQRLGFLLEVILKQDLGNHLYQVSRKVGLNFFRIPLNVSGTVKGFSSDEKWKVIINSEIRTNK